jgi:N4-gp56 family major capsid protein
MAATEYTLNHPMAKQHWSSVLFREALADTQLLKFMGKDSGSMIQVKESMKSDGYKETFGLRMQLAGRGRTGDQTLEGYEEELTLYNDSVQVDQLRHAVRTKGRASEQRVPFSTREEAKDGLKDWLSGRVDTVVMNHLAGISTETDAAYTGNNSITAPDATHIIYANGESAETNLSDSTSSRFTLTLFDEAIEKAKTLSPIIRPIKIKGSSYYCAFLHPNQVKDLRTEVNSGKVTWYGVQSSALQGSGNMDNPIFTGALGTYNNVIIHESNYVPLAPSTTAVRRAVFCGAQAGVVAFGKASGPGRINWVESLFDYENQLGVAIDTIWGAKRTIFNAKSFGSIVITTGAA